MCVSTVWLFSAQIPSDKVISIATKERQDLTSDSNTKYSWMIAVYFIKFTMFFYYYSNTEMELMPRLPLSRSSAVVIWQCQKYSPTPTTSTLRWSQIITSLVLASRPIGPAPALVSYRCNWYFSWRANIQSGLTHKSGVKTGRVA